MNTQEQNTDLLDHMSAAREHWQSVSAIKEAIEQDDLPLLASFMLSLDMRHKKRESAVQGGILPC